MAATLLAMLAAILASQPVTPQSADTPAGSADAPDRSAPSQTGVVEVFPSVRIDRATRLVEFDSTVIADLTDPKKKLYLEVLACPRDSKEHESLVMTLVKPSQVHAALLLAGFKPGRPLVWPRGEPGKPTPPPTPPEGDAVNVEFVWTDPKTHKRRTALPLEWVVNAKAGGRASALGHGFVFAGSVLTKTASGKERYDADGSGTLIGLASFGDETIAWTRPFSPESSVDEPVWIADRDRVPPLGTKVVVRLTPTDASNQSAPASPSEPPKPESGTPPAQPRTK